MTASRGGYVHASCVLLGEAGVLIRGPSGAGKSTLARELIEAGGRAGRFARLVGDDRVSLEAAHGRLLARPHPALSGRIEVRGVGLRERPWAGAAVVRIVVDCGFPRLDRLPEAHQLWTDVMGVRVRRVVAGPGQADRVLMALEDGDAPTGTGEAS
ncbi:HPr kinase/phosphatase C-terminal domain-containing protein [Alsobacter sp. SYSU M60028]|uniref:HPr kinase/phosphatase C-terminal domain-containing protein n=1 Tax=Alsobacter ponti TaxID=2962936 RepID=A0ABT1LHX0_9HYPH|nr:HPr kinase/phosphatase C-terminal domain-containing protein [Alsobacter ponti]MCP8940551.1 HPr kinase/phosphatase C-terminal domain-containing protein [Alsobacter ponti]